MKGIYILADYPDKKTFEKELTYAMNSNIDFIEIGIPFNDPVADGPTIAKAANEIAERGYDLLSIIDLIGELKKKKVYLMTYSNIIYKFGVKKFSDIAKGIVDGLILADLPNRGHNFFYKLGLEVDIINFLTPESRDNAIKKLVNAEGDFIYFIGVRGITGGEVDFNNSELRSKYISIKKEIDKKVILGFGVKTKADTKTIMEYADGFVIGTEIVKRQNNYKEFKKYIDEIFTT
ncbi:MAG: tryptophan synthase subunit alpha [Calditerrivibrio sp.]|nr:tryptophan synthase subunit alpha [Calditerrivibrio sp.]